MRYYIYAADVWCEACGRAIKAACKLDGTEPADTSDETTWDSGEYPKRANTEDNPVDSPQHCASGDECPNALTLPGGGKVGGFITSPLTAEGENYVREMHRDRPSEVTSFWMDYYGLNKGDDDGNLGTARLATEE